MDSDADLLNAFIEQRSEAAFAGLVQRHLPLVYGAALRRVDGDTHRAEDVAQTVFTTLARKASVLRRHPALAGWLYTATNYCAAKVMRAEHRRSRREEGVQIDLGGNDARWGELRPIIDDALLDLAESDRVAILLRYFQDETFPAIGARLGLTDNGARMRTDRALDSLRSALAKRGITSTAAAISGALAAHGAVLVPGGLATAIAANATAASAGGGLMFLMSTSTMKTGAVVAALAAGAFGLLLQHVKITDLGAELAAARVDRDENARRAMESFRSGRGATQSNQAEIERLRAEVARLEAIPPPNEAMAAWALRLASLKQRMARQPEQNIPELRFITEEEWLDAAKRNLETDADYRTAMSDVRNYAEAALVQKHFQPALKRYLQANGNQFPNDLVQLQSYFQEPIESAILQRWVVRTATEVGASGLRDKVIVQKAPIDLEYDHLRAMTESSQFLTTWPVPIGGVNYPRSLAPVITAYREANNGQDPANPAQLAPYTTTVNQQAVLQRTIAARESGSQPSQAVPTTPGR